MPLDLTSLDTTALPAGPETDAAMAEWMGWKSGRGWVGEESQEGWWMLRGKVFRSSKDWSPSTNPAHAGVARRKADNTAEATKEDQQPSEQEVVRKGLIT